MSSEDAWVFVGSLVLFSVVMVLIWCAIVWREERGWMMSRRALDREWCWHYRDFGRNWAAIAENLRNAGGEPGPWLESKIAEMKREERYFCEKGGLTDD